MVHLNQTMFHHGELQAPRMVKDEKAVSAVQNLIDSWNNPFAEDQNFVIISTVKEAPDDVRWDLLQAQSIGEEEYQKFKRERLESTPPKVKFHNSLKLKKLKTFSSLSKEKKIKTTGRAVILKADRTLFTRMIILGQSQKIDVRDLLSHSLGPLPWALATPAGLPRKTNKAALAAQLQKNEHLVQRIPDNAATIIDAMGLVQEINVASSQTSFGRVASTFFTMALNAGGPQITRIDIVFDTYREIFINNVERGITREVERVQLANITATQIIRQWTMFLSEMKNKTSLIRFLSNEFKKEEYRKILQCQRKVLFYTSKEKCWKITGESVEEVPELASSHEEDDTRLLLHAAHAGGRRVIKLSLLSQKKQMFLFCYFQSVEQ